MNSLIIAFAMYSKIPMPKVEWTEKDMRHAICFFPLIGVFIAAIFGLVFYMDYFWDFGKILKTSLLVGVPVIVTGGIHLDGLLDTIDAKHSYGDREKKLSILSDPHTGAFAIIGCALYFVIQFGFYSEINSDIVWLIMIGFVYSRALSGLASVSFRLAKNTGLLATFSNQAEKNTVKITMCIYVVLCGIGMVFISPLLGIFCLLTGIIMFYLYRHFAYKEFGGISGDLAGYFLQMTELFIAIVAVFGYKIFLQ